MSKGLVAIIVVVLSFVFFYTFNSKNVSNNLEDPPSLVYIERLKEERKAKDNFLKNDTNSPLVERANFKGLNYYEYNPTFKFKADLQLAPKNTEKFILNSSNQQEKLGLYGTVSFEMENQKFTLEVYKTPNAKMLFLPFKDSTTGKETYGGGRYIDIPMSNIAGNKVLIDFNLSYHPTCVYNHDYVCPIPPLQNMVKCKIIAGEKL